ncbi:hypothetical protein ELI13_14445 [Rhizobium ruizarguesonis]|jgi:hypothetical protein|uniref:Uncharacterized protein n=3 Tax=Rhizobium TaxID=379 RepID=A0A179BIU3_RHILE|nr:MULTISPECIES: hypothetical protein [Rhizobium]NKJ77046.1 hypothetical protein [Rhizobium leguminosarum bv. viciae]QJS28627.1 hypothetical protein RLTA1_15515 [Rhizobium leguminosarum bv. trifolii TA1]MBC2804792.1 hypothetical protein [Rhizobium ruizarguesonis]MBY5361334.1 hypothetical protein [Rhizobium leguminosarum]MBY5407204.1 hypothetical protein [Rhizobium leguminosarum]
MNRLAETATQTAMQKDIGALERHVLASRDIATQIGDPFLSYLLSMALFTIYEKKAHHENEALRSSFS